MRKADEICALILLGIGTLVIYDARKYGVFGWGLAGPDPGMYPFLLGGGVVVGSLILLGQSLFGARRSASDKPFIPSGGLKPVLTAVIPAALMVFLTHFIGLYLAAGAYLAVYMRWIGKYRWITVLAVSILIPLVGYLVFDKWFLIPLPEGSLTGRLGF
ncbi:MAG: tripartite tricarboxylate transporter TctB family protein [Nitrospinae bacterium]|nr:tripartite tricarboxylate transporter TctB family protein [Nitrospinota bacterium]